MKHDKKSSASGKINKIKKLFIVTIILSLITIVVMVTAYLETSKLNANVEELNDKDNNVYCLASISCENSCNEYFEGDSFSSCRYKCLTLKNCD